MALNKAKVITVTSVKGGTGKTTTVLNLAGILSEMKLRTIIVDLDLYSGSIKAMLNLTDGSDLYTLCEDYMNNRFNQFSDYVAKYNDYLDILAAPADPRNGSKIKAKYISIILARLVLQYDVILIDTSHIMEQNNLLALDSSDEVLYVITNDLMDIKNMKTMLSIYQDMNKDNYRIILNEAYPNYISYTKTDVKNVLGANIDCVIPKSFFNHHIADYVYNGKIMTLDKSIMKSKGAIALKKLIEEIVKE